jgi:hypothetical protein
VGWRVKGEDEVGWRVKGGWREDGCDVDVGVGLQVMRCLSWHLSSRLRESSFQLDAGGRFDSSTCRDTSHLL